MSTKYEITKRGHLINYTPYYINVESTDKEFMDFMDKELDSILKKINEVY